MAVMEPVGAAEADTRPWAIYARLSKKQDGGVAKCDYQVRVCTDYAKANSIPIDPKLAKDGGLVFIDDSLSAWKKGVVRRWWDQMMEMASRGELPGILVWEASRFTRRPSDLERLIDLAADDGVTIAGPGGRFDLTTAAGRRDARSAGNQAAAESDFNSERVKATLKRKMEEGKPMGPGRMYGFEKGGLVQRPAEVAVIREVAQRMLAGEPTAHIAADLNSRGLTTSRGGRFTVNNLPRLMVRLRNAGLVEHSGRVVGTMPGEPVLDRETFEALSAQVASRRRGRPPTGRYPLTGLLWCSDCQRSMNGGPKTNASSPKRIYRCPPQGQPAGCARSIDAGRVEAIVDAYMIKLLSDPTNIAQVSAREQALTDALTAQLAKVEAVEEQLAELELKWAMGELVPRAYQRAKPALDKRLATERARLDGLAHPGPASPIDARADWEAMTDDEKRVVITQFLVRIEIGPHDPKVPGFDQRRVRITRP
jgi:DNA invertase Pin-like site-specific DNA recombinase